MTIGRYPARVKETTTTTGTGTITLSGTAATGFRTFNASLTDGSSVDYLILQQDGSQWEEGEGVFTAPTTLSRVTVYANQSSTTSLVNFSAGTKDVFVTFPSNDVERVISNGRALALASRVAMI